MLIPEPGVDARRFWERLRNPVLVERAVCGRTLPFVIEPPRSPYFYPCTVDDVAELLGFIPSSDLGGIAFIALRQPTRKEALLAPVWGRLIYQADVAGLSGPAIILEAQRSPASLRWPKSLQPWEAAELELLSLDGHLVLHEARGYRVTSDASAMRATQLFRTVPHEIAHYLDYRQRVIEPGTSESAFNRLQELYWARPAREREAFADRYAREFRTAQASRVPFDRRFDEVRITEDGLQPGWFQSPSAA